MYEKTVSGRHFNKIRARHHMNMQPISLCQVQIVWRFKKLEAVHARNHIQNTTNITVAT